MYQLIRPVLFRLDAEQAHNLTLVLLRIAGNFPVTNYILAKLFNVSDPRFEVEAFGVRFPNPLGLAAGYDKNGVAIRGLACLGFGHLEIGTVTRFAQAGNLRPRIYRVPESHALINSMGFPNAGVERLKFARGATRVGINIGKSKDTPLEYASEDYCELLKRVHPQADYVALNVSSPNTPGLRQLQSRAAINDLLRTVAIARDSLAPRVPLLVKISPDLSEVEIDDVLTAIYDHGIDGIIATNTTSSRDGAPTFAETSGGLSGEPLRSRATTVIRFIAQRTEGKLPIIGVGGISSAADALEKLRAGATLIQIYTGLVYKGPGLVREINRGLVQACERAGVDNVKELAAAPPSLIE
jgi:dihydroorotate dehydrogenase